MSYLDEAKLFAYDNKLKGWVSSQESKTITSSIYPWTKTAKAGVVSCYPVGGTELKPVVDFLFTETPPVSGDKSPTNPSTISGVSEVGVTDNSINLFDAASLPSSISGVAVSVDPDGTITLNGTVTNTEVDSRRWGFGVVPVGLMLPREKYGIWTVEYISGSISASGTRTYALAEFGTLRSDNNTPAYLNRQITAASTGSAYNPQSYDRRITAFSLSVYGGQTYNNFKFRLMFEPSDVSTPSAYEVSEHVSVALPLGSTYYGGSIDLATGLMTVTVGATILDENYNFGTTSGYLTEYSGFYAIVFYPGFGPYRTGYNIPPSYTSNRLPIEYKDSSGVPTQNSLLLGSNSRGMKLCLSKSDLSLGDGATIAAVRTAMLQWLSTHPVTITCPLETPTTVQLTPTEILSLAQPDKYTPRLNTLYTDASSVQVGYVKSPIREEYELTQAIVAQGGNV